MDNVDGEAAVDHSTNERTIRDKRQALDAPRLPTRTRGVAVRQAVRHALYAVIFGAVSVVLLLLLIRLAPTLGVLAYFPTLFGLEVLERLGINTLHGSPDGWPVPTNLGLIIGGGSWWMVFTLPAWLFFRCRQIPPGSMPDAI